ncbi:Voltage-dependent calcium channel type A subunit alpha-1 [Pseudolycoriella hygida]|uniref:Voltage-dependent calcium channel type A subunit alpha-1 n=1 Tax=Pseudolycoriella hygida TaxID=35572 RepID=A0A9Q0MQL1_9DIPT|nr:Voltage-dependent calcium channel type A subunit alpha-1 [Pseudolycoriella hygida]
MAAMEKSNSRAGSMSIDGNPDGVSSQTHLLQGHQNNGVNNDERSSLSTLARRSTKRNRSLRSKKVMLQPILDINDIESRRPSLESLTGDGHLHPGYPHNVHRRSPSLRRSGSPLVRTPSPRRSAHHPHHDIGFSDTVSNVVEIVKEERGIRSHRHYGHSRFMRGSWSASTSPARSPSPNRYPHGGGNHRRRNYLQNPARGTTSLCQRSRSPSPARLLDIRERDRLADEMGGQHVQHSYPVLVATRGKRRLLPRTPCKPSTLHLNPTNINFPKLNTSPTHTHHSTPHSVHSLPHSRDFLRDKDMYYSSRDRERDRAVTERMLERMRGYDLRYEYRDRERELFERQLERESLIQRWEYNAPLSFEQALAMGRTGRVLSSPVSNGYKPKDTIKYK